MYSESSQSYLQLRHNLPWLNKEIVQLITKRNLLFRRAHKSGNRDDQEKFKQLRNRVVSKLRSAKTKCFTNLHPHNTKDFWKLVKSVKPRSSTFPTLELGDIVAPSDLEKASLLNDVFINSFNLSTPVLDVSDLPTTDPNECPESLFCTEDEVYEMLSTLDTTKSSGHDEISARMLKETALSVTPAVTQLFNISISLGELPDEWKIARVSPIPKSSNHSDPSNYRPVSLLSVLSKLLERHTRNTLLDHLTLYSPISAQQWGFSQGKSATGALLAATDQWHQWLDSGTDICAVFFDYRKAFDSVPHKPLLEKLKATNINPYLLRWITPYLTSRVQYVCVNAWCFFQLTHYLHVSSGVPQGSVIGPLLFIFYVNDISSISLSNGTLSLFADDVLLYHSIQKPVDYQHLQIDIDNLCEWTDDSHLQLNRTKCKFMVISRKRQPILPSQPLTVNHSQLERVYSYKYLSVWQTSPRVCSYSLGSSPSWFHSFSGENPKICLEDVHQKMEP